LSQPEILMIGPMMQMIEDQLDAAFTVHRHWQVDDFDALVDTVAPVIRGIATSHARPVDAALIDRLPNLEVISNFGVGYDTVDAAHAGSKGILVTNTPDVLTEEVADTAFGLLLMTVRELSAAERHLRAGKWSDGAYPLTRSSLRDRTMGILGLGRIGKAIARRAEASEVGVVYCGRSQQPDVDYRYYADLVDMARDVDILMSVIPGGAATQHIINAEVIEALGPQGILINVGRGSAVDEKALISALQSGALFAAGLDVFEHEPSVPDELMALNNAVLLPHVGSASVHTRDAMGQLVVDNLTGWFASKSVLTPVAETPVS